MQLFTSSLKHTKKNQKPKQSHIYREAAMCAEPVYPCEVNDRSSKAPKRSWSRLDVSVRKRSGNIFQSAWLTSLSYFKEQELYEAG